MHAALDRRLLTLRCLREVWAADLSICALGSLFAPAVGESTGAATSALHLDASTPGAEGEPEQVARYEIDSDDASDAYSSGEDEDEPLADMLDELEGAAVDLDVDGDGQSDAEAAGGGPAVEHVPPVAEETVRQEQISCSMLMSQAGGTKHCGAADDCHLGRQR